MKVIYFIFVDIGSINLSSNKFVNKQCRNSNSKIDCFVFGKFPIFGTGFIVYD